MCDLDQAPRAPYFPLHECGLSPTVTGEQWYRFSGPTPSEFNVSILGRVQKSPCGNWGSMFSEIFHHIMIPFPTLCRNPPTLPPCWDPDLEKHPFLCIEFNLTRKAESRRCMRRMSQQNRPLPWRKCCNTENWGMETSSPLEPAPKDITKLRRAAIVVCSLKTICVMQTKPKAKESLATPGFSHHSGGNYQRRKLDINPPKTSPSLLEKHSEWAGKMVAGRVRIHNKAQLDFPPAEVPRWEGTLKLREEKAERKH